MRAKELRAFVFNTARQGAEDEPRCRHFGECGGCSFQDRSYASQVAAKLAGLHAIWDGAGLPEALPALSVVPSPEAYGYRTRMDYVSSRGRFGLRRRHKFNAIIDLSECHLLPPEALPLARTLWQRLTEAGIPDYDVKTHEGFLRYIVVRRSPPPDDRLLLALVTSSDAHEQQLAEAAAELLEHERVASVYWLLNEKLTDISFGEPLRAWGEPTLAMRVGTRTLQIGPNTFFQNNVFLLERLLDDAAAHLLPETPVADLYGGVGTIALHIADRAPLVVTVESVAESAALAEQNIAANGVGNLRAVAQDVLPFLREQPPASFGSVIADPPRVGLGPEVCQELLRLRPERLIYISCNPLTQRDDYAILREGFVATSLRGYDMFPQTPHLETLMTLEARSQAEFML
jgi:23S rRNA (uracil-5-)-methyltransferase RumA